MSETENPERHPDFTLMLGGPLFQRFRRASWAEDAPELARRRAIFGGAITWLPLLILSLAGGHALGGDLKIPFLYDIEAHVRFLIALPILIVAELIVHSRIAPTMRRFVERRIVIAADIPKFREAADKALRVRNSVAVEIALIVLVYTVGIWVWFSQIAVGAESWYTGRAGLTFAGYWYAFVSIPIFQFILLRWYLRFFLWFQFLWRVSRLDLHLIATHPDRATGLGFLGTSSYAFGPILFAQGALLSGLIASRVLYEGQDLMSFKVEAGGFVVFFMVFILCPLLVFTPKMARAKRHTLRDYGRLGSRYVDEFHAKWIHGGAPVGEELIGSGDIQSLADLGNSFSVVQDTRPVPFALKDVLRLGATAAAPLVPLGLTVLSLEELVARLIKILF